jgi:hypothetical protein
MALESDLAVPPRLAVVLLGLSRLAMVPSIRLDIVVQKSGLLPMKRTTVILILDFCRFTVEC